MLKFSPANAKIEALKQVKELAKYLENGRKVYSLDSLAGHSCPFAEKCLSKVIETNGKRTLVDGPKTEFRCFSATQEVVFPAVYNLRKHNYDLIKACKKDSDIVRLLVESMPKNLGILRFNVDGDFMNPRHFYASVNFASLFPDKLFYAYTKSLPYWVKYRSIVDKIPNLVLTASWGGRRDDLITSEGFRSAKVIFAENEATGPIDHTDEWAANPINRNVDFNLLIHSQQPAGSKASKALQLLRKNNVKHSYSRKS